MALGDGANWDESVPTDASLVSTIDDYDRDLRVGVRSRMAFEHEWPSSQSATNEAGKHKFITLQNQAAKPTLSGTQVAAVYVKTSAFYFEETAGVEIQITTGTSLNFGGLSTLVSTRLMSAWLCLSASNTAGILGSYNISSVTRNGAGDYTVVFSTAFANTAYSVAGMAQAGTDASDIQPRVVELYNTATAKLVGSCRLATTIASIGKGDVHQLNVQFIGVQ